jgi:hypothetical protein
MASINSVNSVSPPCLPMCLAHSDDSVSSFGEGRWILPQSRVELLGNYTESPASTRHAALIPVYWSGMAVCHADRSLPASYACTSVHYEMMHDARGDIN